MRVRYLDSRSVETFIEAVLAAAGRANEIDIATAFLTSAGAAQVRDLVERLTGAKRKRRVRVLVGTWLQVTEPTALRSLRRVGGLHPRIAKEPGFHVKHLSLRGSGKIFTFTGSANLTAKGLGGAGELVAEISDKLASPTDTGERDMFRRMWEDAYPDELTDEVINEYAAQWSPRRFISAEVNVRWTAPT